MRIFWLNGAICIQGQNGQELEALGVVFRGLQPNQEQQVTGYTENGGKESSLEFIDLKHNISGSPIIAIEADDK